MLKNLIQHIESTTRQPEKLKTFYGKIFDWKFIVAYPGYTMIDGSFHSPDGQIPTGITPYVNVEDLDKTEEAITAAGGRIIKSRQEVSGRGWFTIFADPDNNIMAVWEAKRPPSVSARGSIRPATGEEVDPRRETLIVSQRSVMNSTALTLRVSDEAWVQLLAV